MSGGESALPGRDPPTAAPVPPSPAAPALAEAQLLGALATCLLALDEGPDAFARAALAWHGRLCERVTTLCLVEAKEALGSLIDLPGPSRPQAALHLTELCRRHGLADGAVLVRSGSCPGSVSPLPLMRPAGGSSRR